MCAGLDVDQSQASGNRYKNSEILLRETKHFSPRRLKPGEVLILEYRPTHTDQKWRQKVLFDTYLVPDG